MPRRILRAMAPPAAAGMLLAACVSVPLGPSVLVLPGTGKSFGQFEADDVACQQWARQQTGTTARKASTDTAVSGAAIGTAVGAAVGAAIGAAAGSPATGAAVGAGAGLLGGTAVGASAAEGAHTSVQRRYDMAYMQCMYAKGNQIPVRRGSHPAYTSPRSAPPPATSSVEIPPPPAGTPPPPPAGPAR